MTDKNSLFTYFIMENSIFSKVQNPNKKKAALYIII